MKYLSYFTREGQTKLFDRTGTIFAFSREQFNRQKVEGRKYTNAGYGMLIPKGREEEVVQGLEKVQQEAIDKDMKAHGAHKIIVREYFNHECQLTMNTEDAKEALAGHIERFPKEFSDEALKKGFKAAWEEALEKDLF